MIGTERDAKAGNVEHFHYLRHYRNIIRQDLNLAPTYQSMSQPSYDPEVVAIFQQQ